jgi:hypothetical protein
LSILQAVLYKLTLLNLSFLLMLKLNYNGETILLHQNWEQNNLFCWQKNSQHLSTLLLEHIFIIFSKFNSFYHTLKLTEYPKKWHKWWVLTNIRELVILIGPNWSVTATKKGEREKKRQRTNFKLFCNINVLKIKNFLIITYCSFRCLN